MGNTLSTMPYGTFSTAISASSFLDGILGIYKYGYNIWCWTTLATSIVDKEAKENAKLITAGATISLATSFFSTFSEPYAKIARHVALGFYAIEAFEHMHKTWTSLNLLVEAFLEDQGSYVVPLHSLPEWSHFLVDEDTGQWLLTALHLTAIKVQRVGGALLIVTVDLLLVPYYMRRVQEAYNSSRVEEEKNKTLTLYHAKLLAHKIGVYQDIIRKNSNEFEKLINTILGSTTETVNFNMINDATKQVSKCLDNKNNPITKVAYNVFSDLLYCITDIRLNKFNSSETQKSSPKREQKTPSLIDTNKLKISDSKRAQIEPVRKNLLKEFNN